jgi:hypothetical protein
MDGKSGVSSKTVGKLKVLASAGLEGPFQVSPANGKGVKVELSHPDSLEPVTPILKRPLSSPASQTTLDLSSFRRHALGELEKVLGATPANGRIFFQDGAASTDLPPVFDQARLYFVADPPPGTLPAPYKVAHVFSFQGEAFTIPVELNEAGRIVPLAWELTTTFDDTTTEEQIKEFAQNLRRAFPGAEIQALSSLGMMTVSTDPATLSRLEKALELSSLKTTSTFSRENFRVPFEFGQPIDLGEGLVPHDVDLASLTTVTKSLRDQGIPFTTQPSLPRP